MLYSGTTVVPCCLKIVILKGLVLMSRYLTRTLNISKYLVKIYISGGREVFLQELRERVMFICREWRGRPDQIDKHLNALISGVIAILFDNQSEIVIRKRSQFADDFSRTSDIQKKVRVFAEAFDLFLRTIEIERAEEKLAERVVSHLKTCDLETLKNMTLESLAESFGYSKNYFAERFKMEHELTLHNVVTHEKMNRAFRLLNQDVSRPTVKEISRMLGFSDPVYFSRLFRKKYGILPSKVNKT